MIHQLREFQDEVDELVSELLGEGPDHPEYKKLITNAVARPRCGESSFNRVGSARLTSSAMRNPSQPYAVPQKKPLPTKNVMMLKPFIPPPPPPPLPSSNSKKDRPIIPPRPNVSMTSKLSSASACGGARPKHSSYASAAAAKIDNSTFEPIGLAVNVGGGASAAGERVKPRIAPKPFGKLSKQADFCNTRMKSANMRAKASRLESVLNGLTVAVEKKVETAVESVGMDAVYAVPEGRENVYDAAEGFE